VEILKVLVRRVLQPSNLAQGLVEFLPQLLLSELSFPQNLLESVVPDGLGDGPFAEVNGRELSRDVLLRRSVAFSRRVSITLLISAIFEGFVRVP
jgi:hypothetical protein